MYNKPEPTHGEQTATSDRREFQRHAFICPAELIVIGGATRISARTTDLSLQGCYIDTLNPFPVGTAVRLQLTKNAQRLEVRAAVTSCHVGSGMGLVFDQLALPQVDTLVSWLEAASSSTEAAFSSPASAGVPERAPNPNLQFATKLLRLLIMKGIVTPSEAAELLDNLNSEA